MRPLPFFLLLSVAVSGCGITETKEIDYKSATKVPTLEVPPDLVAPSVDNRFVIPEGEGGGAATLSTYRQARAAEPGRAQGLLPAQEKARIERAGSQRWLVVQATPEQAWPLIKDFWQETGFIIDRESPETGVMETDWAENRARIPQDVIRRTLGKVIDGLYSTAERDKFRTRIEAGRDGTEIYVSHRGMMEVYETEERNKTIWQPRPADPDLEAEMLRRLMIRFGVQEARAGALLARQQTPEQARLVREAGGQLLEMDENFDRAWRRVGLALDRVGFAVEDRDRSRGTYFVRYIDPGIDNAGKRSDGLLSGLVFWRSKKEQTSPQLQIIVTEAGERSRVAVADAEGNPADEAVRSRILNLLHKELK